MDQSSKSKTRMQTKQYQRWIDSIIESTGGGWDSRDGPAEAAVESESTKTDAKVGEGG